MPAVIPDAIPEAIAPVDELKSDVLSGGFVMVGVLQPVGLSERTALVEESETVLLSERILTSGVPAVLAPGTLVTSPEIMRWRTSTGVLEDAVQGVLGVGLVEELAMPAGPQATERSTPARAEETESSPTARGLGLAAPYQGSDANADFEAGSESESRAPVPVDLAVNNAAPPVATGDWDMMPEVGFAAIPLALAAAVVIGHGRRSARIAAAPARRRHANF